MVSRADKFYHILRILWRETVFCTKEYQGTCSVARSSVMINKDAVINWSMTDRSRGSDPRDSREERDWFSKNFWEWIRWREREWRAVVRVEIRILVPSDGRHRLKTRIVELPAVPRSSFNEHRRLMVVIAVKVERRTVTLGTADQLVHITSQYPKVRLVRAHSRGHEFLEWRRENPYLLTTVFRRDNL